MFAGYFYDFVFGHGANLSILQQMDISIPEQRFAIIDKHSTYTKIQKLLMLKQTYEKSNLSF